MATPTWEQQLFESITSMLAAKPNLSILPVKLGELMEAYVASDESVDGAAIYKREGAYLLLYQQTNAISDKLPKEMQLSIDSIHTSYSQAFEALTKIPANALTLGQTEQPWGLLVVIHNPAFTAQQEARLKMLALGLSTVIQHAKMEEQLHTNDKLFHSLYQLNSVHDLFPSLVRQLYKSISFDAASLTVYDPYEPHRLKVHSCRIDEKRLIDLRQSYISHAASITAQEMVSPLTEPHAGPCDLSFEEDQLMSYQAYASVLRIPILQNDRKLGMLHLYSSRSLHFDAKAIHVLCYTLGQFMPFLNHLCELERAFSEKQFRKLAQSIEEQFLQTTNLREGAQKCAEILRRTYGFSDMQFWILDEQKLELKCITSDQLNLAMNESPAVAEILLRKQTVCYNHIQSLTFISSKLHFIPAESVMMVPLMDMADQQVIGLFIISDAIHNNRFNEMLCGLFDHHVSPRGSRIGKQFQHAQLERRHLALIKALTIALDKKDAETQGHSERVVQYTLNIARAMGLKDSALEMIRWGALLHDIGKIGVPDAILLKPGKLDDEEWRIMRTHPAIGFEMMKDIDFLENSLDIVLYHHERWDGKGYPHGLAKEEIPLGARIFAIADTFDAITSDRPYRKAQSIADARRIISENVGTQFCPQATAAFMSLSDRHLEQIRAHFQQSQIH